MIWEFGVHFSEQNLKFAAFILDFIIIKKPLKVFLKHVAFPLRIDSMEHWLGSESFFLAEGFLDDFQFSFDFWCFYEEGEQLLFEGDGASCGFVWVGVRGGFRGGEWLFLHVDGLVVRGWWLSLMWIVNNTNKIYSQTRFYNNPVGSNQEIKD